MRVCDKCMKKIDNETRYRINVECFSPYGAYNHVKSYVMEICEDCQKKIEAALSEEKK